MFGKRIYESDYSVSIKDYKTAVDFCVLSPLYGEKDIEKAANIAYKNHYRSICVLPFLVEHAKAYIDQKLASSVNVGTVVDFPLGASLLSTKVEQTKRAFANGASYVDVVINLSNIKNNDMGALKREVARLVHLARKEQINIVLETSALSRDEIEKVVKVCTKCKVDYIMTNTGFGNGGATPEAVAMLKEMVNNKCGIKAAGGISTREEVWNLLRSGASLVATSREV